MKQERLKLYIVDIKYVRDLAKKDDNVMSISPQKNKENRPFVGIVIICENKKYCIPLSSPKEKHKAMKNDIDFMKIYDGDKIVGVLNFNNMIPIHERYAKILDLKINKKDSIPIIYYKKVCTKQLKWCREHQEVICKKANKLYKMIIGGKANSNLKRRCCDFRKLENILKSKICDMNKY